MLILNSSSYHSFSTIRNSSFFIVCLFRFYLSLFVLFVYSFVCLFVCRYEHCTGSDRRAALWDALLRSLPRHQQVRDGVRRGQEGKPRRGPGDGRHEEQGRTTASGQAGRVHGERVEEGRVVAKIKINGVYGEGVEKEVPVAKMEMLENMERERES